VYLYSLTKVDMIIGHYSVGLEKVTVRWLGSKQPVHGLVVTGFSLD